LSIDALESTTLEIKQNSDRAVFIIFNSKLACLIIFLGDLNRKIKHWLYPVDLETMHQRAFSACQAGTGLWFIDQYLEEWISGRHQSRFLYLEGKCTLSFYSNLKFISSLPNPSLSWIWKDCSLVNNPVNLSTEELRLIKQFYSSAAIEKTKHAIQKSTSTQILYFYCSFRSAMSQQPDHFLGSILSQLSSTFPEILRELRDSFERRVLPTIDALVDLVCRNLIHLEKTVLFVDAVNESAESDAFFSILSSLVNSIPNLFIMVTSTTPPPALYSDKSLFKVRMQSNSNKDDIHAFIYEQLQSRPSLRRLSPDAKNQIIATLTKKADGM
jgi:hypothetical protein